MKTEINVTTHKTQLSDGKWQLDIEVFQGEQQKDGSFKTVRHFLTYGQVFDQEPGIQHLDWT